MDWELIWRRTCANGIAFFFSSFDACAPVYTKQLTPVSTTNASCESEAVHISARSAKNVQSTKRVCVAKEMAHVLSDQPARYLLAFRQLLELEHAARVRHPMRVVS